MFFNEDDQATEGAEVEATATTEEAPVEMPADEAEHTEEATTESAE